jgi:AhpD family alkylhydroperoxidase
MSQRVDFGKASPDGMKALGSVSVYVTKCGLDATLVDLVYLRVSQINGCAYCIDKHTRDLIKREVKIDKIVLVPVWHEAGGLFTDKEKAALAWAESLTQVSQTHVPDADFTAASAVFNEKELTDLTIAVGLMNAYNRLAISLRMPPAAVHAA